MGMLEHHGEGLMDITLSPLNQLIWMRFLSVSSTSPPSTWRPSFMMSRDSIFKRSIEHGGTLVGHIMSFGMLDEQYQSVREITYWINHRFGGKGIASEGLR